MHTKLHAHSCGHGIDIDETLLFLQRCCSLDVSEEIYQGWGGPEHGLDIEGVADQSNPLSQSFSLWQHKHLLDLYVNICTSCHQFKQCQLPPTYVYTFFWGYLPCICLYYFILIASEEGPYGAKIKCLVFPDCLFYMVIYLRIPFLDVYESTCLWISYIFVSASKK